MGRKWSFRGMSWGKKLTKNQEWLNLVFGFNSLLIFFSLIGFKSGFVFHSNLVTNHSLVTVIFAFFGFFLVFSFWFLILLTTPGRDWSKTYLNKFLTNHNTRKSSLNEELLKQISCIRPSIFRFAYENNYFFQMDNISYAMGYEYDQGSTLNDSSA